MAVRFRPGRRLLVGVALASAIVVAAPAAPSAIAVPAAQMSSQSAQRLDQLLDARNGISATGVPARAEALSRQFLGTPYGADTLIGSATEPEQLVVELQRVDCFTYADYVEALKRGDDRDSFLDALVDVRYQDGAVAFANRKHFFTDWSAVQPAIAIDVTASVSPDAVRVSKNLNQKDSGGTYLPGLPVTTRTVTYVPSGQIDRDAVSRLRTGDYIGAYAPDGGLDVTHVGIYVDTPDGPMFRNASSLSAHPEVVDEPLLDYVGTVPGIVVLRPVR